MTPGLGPMTDMSGAAVAAVVGAQTVRKCSSGHKFSEARGGVTLPLVCPLAGARSHLGASRRHSCSFIRFPTSGPSATLWEASDSFVSDNLSK